MTGPHTRREDYPALAPDDELEDATGALELFPSEAPPTTPPQGRADLAVPQTALGPPPPPANRHALLLAGASLALLVVLATGWIGWPFSAERDAGRTPASAPPARAQRPAATSPVPAPVESRPSAPEVTGSPRAIPQSSPLALRGPVARGGPVTRGGTAAVNAPPIIPAPGDSGRPASSVGRPILATPPVASPPAIVPREPADVPDARIAALPPEAPAPTERREDAPERVDPDAAARFAITETLALYRASHNKLDAVAVSAISLGLDTRGLERAFSTLRSQRMWFDTCDTKLAGDKAQVRCTGTVSYVPIVGASEPHVRPVSWTFDLRRNASRWMIEKIAAR